MEYFYVDIHNNSQGPFKQSDLMKIINEDTVIWREGIEWTEAKKIPELKNYFSIEKNFVKKSNSEKKYLSQDEEILICLNKMKNQWPRQNSLYFKGAIDYRKWNNLASKIGPLVGNIDDCLIYFDVTVFGNGDNGFILTKNIFAWKNNFESATFMYINKNSPGFLIDAELIKFNFTQNHIIAVNQGFVGPEGGHKIFVNISLNPNLNLFIKFLNELLKILK